MRPAWLASLVLIGFVGLTVLWLRAGLIGAEQWPIRWLDVDGQLERTSSSQVRAAVTGEASRGYFAARLDRVREHVEALPWVARAEVSRQWPDALYIRIVEHRPVARWNENRLFSDRGEVFEVSGSQSMQGMTRLRGPDARSQDVLERWQVLRRKFGYVGRDITELVLDERGAWRVELDNGVELVLGRQSVEQRVDRYLRSLPALSDLGAPIQSVDLRYTNGLAVRFAAADELPEYSFEQGGRSWSSDLTSR